MNFKDYLYIRRAKYGFASSAKQYEKLGGERRLGIGLRQYQHIESGVKSPSWQTLVGMFPIVAREERALLLLSFIRSNLEKFDGSEEIAKFLEERLLAVDTEVTGVWHSQTEKITTYTGEQLDYLLLHPDAAKLFSRVLLYEEVPLRKTKVPLSKIHALRDLELVTFDERVIRPRWTLYKIPSWNNASSKLVGKANQYIRRHLDWFLDAGGSSDQSWGYSIQMLNRETAPVVLEQLKNIKKWIDGLAVSKIDEACVPFIHFGFGRILNHDSFE